MDHQPRMTIIGFRSCPFTANDSPVAMSLPGFARRSILLIIFHGGETAFFSSFACGNQASRAQSQPASPMTRTHRAFPTLRDGGFGSPLETEPVWKSFH